MKAYVVIIYIGYTQSHINIKITFILYPLYFYIIDRYDETINSNKKWKILYRLIHKFILGIIDITILT